MYKWILGCGLILMMITANHAEARAIFTVEVQVNGTLIAIEKNGDAGPFIEQTTNITYVPIRFVSDHLGATTDWDKQKQQVTILAQSGTKIELTIGSKIAYVDGEAKTLVDAPVMPLYPNHVMVPLRFVSEVIGAQVGASTVDGILHVNISDR